MKVNISQYNDDINQLCNSLMSLEFQLISQLEVGVWVCVHTFCNLWTKYESIFRKEWVLLELSHFLCSCVQMIIVPIDRHPIFYSKVSFQKLFFLSGYCQKVGQQHLRHGWQLQWNCSRDISFFTACQFERSELFPVMLINYYSKWTIYYLCSKYPMEKDQDTS